MGFIYLIYKEDERGLEFKDVFCTRDKKRAREATCRCTVDGTYDGNAANF